MLLSHFLKTDTHTYFWLQGSPTITLFSHFFESKTAQKFSLFPLSLLYTIKLFPLCPTPFAPLLWMLLPLRIYKSNGHCQVASHLTCQQHLTQQDCIFHLSWNTFLISLQDITLSWFSSYLIVTQPPFLFLFSPFFKYFNHSYWTPHLFQLHSFSGCPPPSQDYKHRLHTDDSQIHVSNQDHPANLMTRRPNSLPDFTS